MRALAERRLVRLRRLACQFSPGARQARRAQETWRHPAADASNVGGSETGHREAHSGETLRVFLTLVHENVILTRRMLRVI